eukprot:gene17105-biopygen11358
MRPQSGHNHVRECSTTTPLRLQAVPARLSPPPNPTHTHSGTPPPPKGYFDTPVRQLRCRRPVQRAPTLGALCRRLHGGSTRETRETQGVAKSNLVRGCCATENAPAPVEQENIIHAVGRARLQPALDEPRVILQGVWKKDFHFI